MRTLPLSLFGLCLLVVSWLPAQDAPVVSLSFTSLSWQKMIKDVRIRNADGEATKLWIPNGSPSKTYEYTGTLPLRFFRETGQDAEGRPIEQTVAEYSPNGSGANQMLIFIRNDRNGREYYRILPLGFDPDGIGENAYRFVNLSEFPVYVKFGEDRFMLNTRGEKTLLADVPESGGQGVAMAIQVSEQPNDVKVVYSSSWSIRQGRSALIFLTTDPDEKDQIQVKKLYF
ncbi:hypothetical protein [Coraliomargarita parva]|uniref:hypothetical protein n=1 Tax=Coraliomargarita parva TaxID=3014050 RepID=UPI0022B532E4|nr:hypothetical protein [Coraliomargarita parva]